MRNLSSPWKACWSGASLAFTAALVYGTAFAILAGLRSATQILQILNPGEGLLMTILATGNSIFISSITFALLFGLIAALVMGFTWMVIYGINGWLNPQALTNLRTWIAVLTSLAVAGFLHLLLWSTDGLLHAVLWRSSSAYLLWIGIPCLIFICLTTLAWRGVHIPLAKGPTSQLSNAGTSR